MRRDDALRGRVHRHPHQRRAVGRTPRRRGRRLAAVHQPLVGVHPLVGDRADLGGVLEDAGDERLADVGQLQRVVGAVERVGLALEQAHVGVHRRTGILGERLGHERRPHTVVERDLLDDVAERHHVVGHRQRVGVAQVDLLLAGRALVVAELHRDAHLTPARRWRAGGSSAPSRARPGRSSRRCRQAPARSRRRGRACSRKNSISGCT